MNWVKKAWMYMLNFFEQMDTNWLQFFILGFIGSNCCVLGTFLIYRRMTMLANAISHTVLLGIAVGILSSKLFSFIFTETNSYIDDPISFISFGTIVISSVIMALLTSFTHERLVSIFHLRPEASIGIVLSGFFSIGIILLTIVARNSHVGIESIMGNVDTVMHQDVLYAAIIFFINSFITMFLFKEYVLTSFDRRLAKTLGFRAKSVDLLLMLQTSATVIVGFKAVGNILVLCYLVGLPLCAKAIIFSLPNPSLKKMIFVGVTIAWLLSAISVLISDGFYQYWDLSLSTGGLSTSILFLLYIFLRIFRRFRAQWFSAVNFLPKP